MSIIFFKYLNRKPKIVQSTLTITESQRYSLDIGEDLKSIIEQKQNQKTVQIYLNKEIVNIPNVSTKKNLQSKAIILKENIYDKENMKRGHNTVYADESFEALEKMCEKSEGGKKNNNVMVWQNSSEESFEALEKMCDKTASDPNSTLFQYLHSDRKDQVLAEAKKRSGDGMILNAQDKEDKLLMKLNNCTLLDDIEAPSRMWETSICGDTILQTSPVKMIGLLRPSTIIEEAPDDSANSDLLSHLSFRTATKVALSDVSSSTYETAHGSTPATIAEPAHLNKKCDQERYSANHISVNLIDLEKTFAPTQYSPQSSMLEESFNKDKEGEEIDSVANELYDSIIEILSDNEDVEIKEMQNIDNIISNNHDKKTEISLNWEKSMQFNDTMEEVEYMIKKGIEYMAAGVSPKKNKGLITNACKNEASRIERNSPMKYTKTVKQANSSTYSTPGRKTSLSKGHSSTSKRFDIDIRPFPKLDVFTKPPVHARTKELTSKLQKFSHIVSPVGTYMKKTAQTPLMSSMNCKAKDYFNSTAIMQFESESRLYQPQFATLSQRSDTMGYFKLPGIASGTKCALPKKAYISSDLKHIVDERTPVTIPGGKKIQKYIENVMMPAVLRHEGKFKMAGGICNKVNTSTSSLSGAHSKLPLKVSDTNSMVTQSTSHVPRRNNASLADLSIMSGDVSMYTIMDAQKF